jgi:hypothetical protein
VTRTRAVVAVLALGLLCAACARTPAEPKDPPVAGPAPDVAFSATVTPHDGSIAVSYRLTNRSSGDLIVPNRVPAYGPSGKLTPDPNAVYVTGGDDGAAVISKRVFPRPDTDKVNWATTPLTYGVIVAPGASVAEDITVPLPLTRRHPYGDDLGDGAIKLPDPVKTVRFCLGVINRAGLPKAPVKDGVVTLAHSNDAAGAQHLSCSGSVKL